tara:strand:- start:3359 stop:4279 length:921 start_codon:yes stop_codon:yes gene_type:complete
MKKLILSTLLALTSISAAATKFEQDRAAILKLSGKFKVSFNFEETLAIKKDYKLRKPYKEEAHEIVKVVKDEGKIITLQHLLVVNGKENKQHVVKHWSQTWKYEDTDIVTFTAKRHWLVDHLAPEQVKGTWSQMVTQTDDSPRYEGYGKWEHLDSRSIWVSNLSPRPLPRREYTKRKDYDIVMATNRNIITENGWAHEQHNAKLVKREGQPEHILAHEIGLNTYTRVDDYDYTVADKYWDAHGKYWEDVRAAWEEIYTEQKEIKMKRFGEHDTLREMTNESVEIAAEKKLQNLTGMKPRILEYFIN